MFVNVIEAAKENWSLEAVRVHTAYITTPAKCAAKFHRELPPSAKIKQLALTIRGERMFVVLMIEAREAVLQKQFPDAGGRVAGIDPGRKVALSLSTPDGNETAVIQPEAVFAPVKTGSAQGGSPATDGKSGLLRCSQPSDQRQAAQSAVTESASDPVQNLRNAAAHG